MRRPSLPSLPPPSSFSTSLTRWLPRENREPELFELIPLRKERVLPLADEALLLNVEARLDGALVDAEPAADFAKYGL